MKQKIVYSPLAFQDIDKVWVEVFEASKSVDVARKYIADLIKKIEKKEGFPKAGSPLYYNDLFTGYYFIVFKAYLVFYRVDDDTLYVERVLMGKSDYIRKILGSIPEEDEERGAE